MNWTGYIITVLLSTFTGWITTWIAIKMLFHPRKPIKILGLTIQGIFPKNQQQIAEKLGYKKGVVKELSSRIYSDPSITADRKMLYDRAHKFIK